MKSPFRNTDLDVLPGPFAKPAAADGVALSPATEELVRSQVQALLQASPSYHKLGAGQRREMSDNLFKIAAYSAALIQDDWQQSAKLRQAPVVRTTVLGPLARAAAGQDAPPRPRSSAPARPARRPG
jgi:hypothetical protein